MLEHLQRIRIVLIATTHPGNIGAVARAMCNMGLARLYLVRPEKYPHPDAVARAASAGHILDQAQIVGSLDEALAGCSLVVGTSARERRIPWPVLPAREVAGQIMREAQREEGEIAVLFGREEHGLTNDELQRCNLHLTIPSNPEYSSLNLAMAVQLISYELRLAAVDEQIATTATEQWDQPWADAQQVEYMIKQLEEVLEAITFLDPANPKQVMTRLRRLFARTRLDKIEIGILRGMFAFILQRVKPGKSRSED